MIEEVKPIRKTPAESGTRTERKKEELKQRIISVAMELFKMQGVEATTMEQIAAEVDIARGTLYNHFPVKEAVIDEYMKRSFREKNSARIEELQKLPGTRERLISILEELTGGVRAYPEIFEKYLIYRLQSMVTVHLEDSEKSGFYLTGREILRLGQASGELRRDIHEYIVIELFEFAFIQVVKQCLAEDESFMAGSVIESCVDLVMHGISHGKASPNKSE